MNLLSKNRNAAPEAESPAGEASTAEQQPQAAPQPAAVPSLLSSLNADSEISSQIKAALQDSLDAEAPTIAKPAESEAIEAAPVAEQLPAPEEPTGVATIEEPSVAEGSVDPVEPSQEESAASGEQPETPAMSDSSDAESDASPDITYINVMQTLVEEKAKKYMEMSGLCTCDRCVADVKALALNGLIPKYVVMNAGEMIPRITLYDGKFSTEVTSQILRACETVKKRPHHHR